MIATIFEMSYPMQTIGIALLVSVVAPTLLALLNNWSMRKAKVLDWEREDQKEFQKEKKANEVADRLLASNKEVAETAALTNGKLDVIHVLVNSNMTAAMRAELDATIRELALMRQIVERDKTDGRPVLPEALAALKSTQLKINELNSTLNDRLKQTQVVSAMTKGE